MLDRARAEETGRYENLVEDGGMKIMTDDDDVFISENKS